MVHPSLDRPILSSIQPMFAHLVHFENIPGLEDLQKRMIRYLTINFYLTYLVIPFSKIY